MKSDVPETACLMQGNEAVVEGALAAGVRFFAGYPITPSTEVAELMAERLPGLGGKFIQMEDEIASMAAVIGASLAGVKALTATSGPGFSLKQENLGYAAMAEIPCVIVNVQRWGPSTGIPTAPAQGDIMQARWGAHGDHPVIALCPASVREAYFLAIRAVNLSEKYRMPVILLMDEVIGHMREKVVLPRAGEIEIIERKKPAVGPGDYYPYRPDYDGVPSMANFGDGYRYHVTGLVHDEKGNATTDPKIAENLILRLHRKIYDHIDDVVTVDGYQLEDAEVVVIAYGAVARPAKRAVKDARAAGIKAGLLRPVTIWPFPEKQVVELTRRARAAIVAEMNLGQLRGEVERVVQSRVNVFGVNRLNGELITYEEIMSAIRGVFLGACQG